MRRQRRGGWKRGSKMEAGRERGSEGARERERGAGGRAGRGPRAGEGGRAGLCGARQSLAVRAPGGGACGRGGHPGALVPPHPSRGPEDSAPARSGTTATGAEAFVARSGPPPSPPSAPPPGLSGLARTRRGRAEAGWCECRPPPAALRFCGVLAAASSHDNELASAEGPGGRSAWRPAETSSWWGGAGGWRLGEKGRRSRAFPLSALPAPDGGLPVKRVQARALPR